MNINNNNMKLVSIGSIRTLPSDPFHKIVYIKLNQESGHVKFDNGVVLSFNTLTLNVLRQYKAAAHVTIYSNGASQGFIKTLEDKNVVWDWLLDQVMFANFHGIWDMSVLSCIVERMPKLDTVSFTYFQCMNFNCVIAAISSTNLREFTAHIGPGQTKAVVNAIGKYGASFMGVEEPKNSLSRLCLIFDDYFHYEPGEYENILRDTLSMGDAKVILIFAGENRSQGSFQKKLEGFGMREDGYVRMAINDLYMDQTVEKRYETYKVFSIVNDYGRWRIGCRETSYVEHASFNMTPVPMQTAPVYRPLDDVSVTLGGQSKVEGGGDYNNMFYYENSNGDLIPQSHIARTRCRVYKPVQPIYTDSRKLCYDSNSNNKTCTSIDGTEEVIQKWQIPGWIETKIQTVIYTEFNTEFKTSNGLYVVVDEMKMEPEFFKDMITTNRVLFVCTTHLRRFIHTENMSEFLLNVVHVEILGEWWNVILEGIFKSFNDLEKITMVQIAFRSKTPIIFILQALGDSGRQKLRWFHIDARATAKDYSIGSIVNALRNQSGITLEDLLIIGNTLESPAFKCGIDKHFTDTSQLIAMNGCATTVVGEVIDPRNIQGAGYRNPEVGVMAPIPYPYQNGNPVKSVFCKVAYGDYKFRRTFMVTSYQ